MRRGINQNKRERVSEPKGRSTKSKFFSKHGEKIVNLAVAGGIVVALGIGAKRCGCIDAAAVTAKDTKKSVKAQTCSIVDSSGTNIFEDENIKFNASWIRSGFVGEMRMISSEADCECTKARGKTMMYSNQYREGSARTEILDMIDDPEKEQKMIVQSGDVIVSFNGEYVSDCIPPLLIGLANYIKPKSDDRYYECESEYAHLISFYSGTNQIMMRAEEIDEKGVTLFLRIEEFDCRLKACSTGRIKLNYDGTAQIKTEDGLSNTEDGAKAKEVLKEIFGFEKLEVQPRDKKEEAKIIVKGGIYEEES